MLINCWNLQSTDLSIFASEGRQLKNCILKWKKIF